MGKANKQQGPQAIKQRLMAEQWELFVQAVGLNAVSEVQRSEMRRAFYAGAHAILIRVIAAFAPEGEPTDADMEIMESVHQELLDFAKDLKDGRA
jgi:hypothetical protein